ncbi:response regulator transcription factor [Qipengyuania spongiae]|uniref:Response regulator transcription factor n=1 Tax=Qipengyuania spongiae TaxID=2909673 RepID=A0ABY5T0B6_9SPHN|nr:response regulator transcription factor [Qipengyuania spongiae]UVI39944.1 response regulator transcription factor [Qipengyuania spongiae]
MIGEKVRIVIAEDQTMVLGALARLLAIEDDFEVVATATDGQKALEAVREHRPDILLTDIEMPGMTGLDLARIAREADAAFRVIIITTYDRGGYLRRALAAGVRGYLLKDSPIEELGEAIRTVARGGRAIAPELAAAAWDNSDDPLSDRDRLVLRLAEEGHSNKAIGKMLSLSPGTVRNYLSEAASKLGASGRIEASRIARENGWL